MKLAMAVVLATSFVFASSTMKVDINVKYNNLKITKSTIAQINANLDEEFSIENNGLKTVIIASKVNSKNSPTSNMKNGYLLNAKVYEQTKTGNKLIGTPQIITKGGSFATISIERDNGEYVEMKVKLTRL